MAGRLAEKDLPPKKEASYNVSKKPEAKAGERIKATVRVLVGLKEYAFQWNFEPGEAPKRPKLSNKV